MTNDCVFCPLATQIVTFSSAVFIWKQWACSVKYMPDIPESANTDLLLSSGGGGGIELQDLRNIYSFFKLEGYLVLTKLHCKSGSSFQTVGTQ